MNKNAYNKQGNYCLSFLRKAKKVCYANLDEKGAIDNNQFWETVTPILSEKIKLCDKIYLIDGDKIVTQQVKNRQISNSLFLCVCCKES